MPAYQLALFYADAKSNEASLREIRREIDNVSANNWCVLSAGAQVCAIGFVTDTPPDQLISLGS